VLEEVGHLLLGGILVNLKEPASLHLSLVERIQRLLGSRLGRSITGNGALESGIERKGSSRAEAEGRGVHAGVGSKGTPAARGQTGTLGSGGRATSGGVEGRRLGDASGAEPRGGRLGLEGAASLGRAGEAIGKSRGSGDGSSLEYKGRGLEHVLGGSLGALSKDGWVNVLRVVGVDQFSLALSSSGRKS
jgi:hypothetical protein